jgi:SAM-dependent methyltransferase
MANDRDYLLGTHDEEIARLGLQHNVWRPKVLDAWRRAGFGPGQLLLDIGSGPGYASLDLADTVGSTGRVIALDRSRRFLDHLAQRCAARGIDNVLTTEVDLDRDPLPGVQADGAWCRWVFAFVSRPRDLLARIAGALRPGGVLVAFEYFHYETWRLAPRVREVEEFVEHLVAGWRATGGEPDIALDLPAWMHELGLELRSIRPIIDIVKPGSVAWGWPSSFIDVNLRRQVDAGTLSEERAAEIARAFVDAERRPESLMILPGVAEMIAVKSTNS